MNSLELLPNWFIAFYVALLGLCVGSFLNVAILRGLSGEELVFSRSRCPKCKNQLKWYMNIPLLSYLFLRGKCAFCKTKISPQYPLVEFTTALMFLIAYFAFGLTLKTLFLCVIFALFIAMSATDFLETVIIDTHAYILLAVGLLYSFLNLGDINIIQAIIGAVFGFAIFEALAWIGVLMAGCRMFGEGDSLIALGLGAIFGWKALLIVIALSILIQTFSAIPILILKAKKSGKIKLCWAYSFVLFSVVFLVLINEAKFIQNEILYFSLTILLVIGLLYCLKIVLVEIRNKKLDDSKNEEEKFCLLPFGPALLISATVCVFYLGQIKSYILDFIS